MKNKLVLILPILFLSITSCGENNNEFKDPLINKVANVTLNNLSPDVPIKGNELKLYFLENGNVPYVSVGEFLDSIDGFIDSKLYSHLNENGVYTFKSKVDNDNYKYFKVDTKKDIVTTDVLDFLFNNIYNVSPDETGSYISFVDSKCINEALDLYTYKLREYNFNTIDYNENLLMPISLINALLLPHNYCSLIYNGNELYFSSYYLTNKEQMFNLRNKKLEGQDLPDDLKEDRNNQLFFTLDNFYGLKEIKNIKSFKTLFNETAGVSDLLNSNKPDAINKALTRVLMRELDDPHSSVSYKNLYQNVESVDNISIPRPKEDIPPRILNLNQVNKNLVDLYFETFEEYSPLRIEGNTAFIKFNVFTMDYSQDIYNSDGTIKPEAIQNDAFALVKYTLDNLKNNNAIKNIVIDLSNNTGGEIYVLYSLIALLTDDPIYVTSHNSVSKYSVMETLLGDSDHDGDFTDLDSNYDFKFHILTSNVTFSAANYFTTVCKDNNIATVIGQQSGGGACVVYESALSDGTVFRYSSPNWMSGYRINESGKPESYNIEFGIKPDIEIGYDKFFDLKYIVDLINK